MMARKIMFVAVAVLLFAATSAAIDCPIAVNLGDVVDLTAWYEHEADLSPGVGSGRSWSSTAQIVVGFDTFALSAASSEGHPVAITWRINGTEVKTCGEIPARIFTDNFELGHLDRWSATHGGL